MKLKTTLMIITISGILAACGVATISNEVSDTQIGLRKSSIENEDLQIQEIDWKKEAAGASQKYERSYENAPPLIPHDTEGLLPITKDGNSCLDCHMPEFAADVGATPIPRSHLIDLRTGKDLGGKLSEARFNCTQCHVPQANTKPLVENNFKPVFRKEESKSNSNLIDVINEGVK